MDDICERAELADLQEDADARRQDGDADDVHDIRMSDLRQDLRLGGDATNDVFREIDREDELNRTALLTVSN